MKIMLQALAVVLFSGLLLASPTSMAVDINDRWDPYVLYDDIDATPAGKTDRLSERFADYLLYDEIMVTESCANPVDELLGARFVSHVTPSELKQAEMQNRC